MTIFFKNVRDLSSISTFTYTMIQTNLIIKNLDHFFSKMLSQSKASQKHFWKFPNRVLISFYDNTRCKNKSNGSTQNGLIFIDIWISSNLRSSEQRSLTMNIWNHISTRVWLQFQNFKCTLLALKVLKIIENLSLIWLMLLVYLITDVILLLM